MTVPAGWEGILDPGEEILWQGRPDGAIVLRPGNVFSFLFGLAFAGFALFWMIMASQAGGGFWAFGLIHFSVGIGLAFGSLFWGAWQRRHTWYTLTNRRAFVAMDMPLKGRSLKSYPISRDMVLELETGPLSTVWFGETTRRGSKGRTITEKIGFQRIPDGPAVHRMIRSIQQGLQ